MIRRLALAASLVLVAGCGWHGLGAVPSEPRRTPSETPLEQPTETPRPSLPPSSVLDWKPNPIQRTSTGVHLFSGTVTNTDIRWSVKEVSVELKLLDAGGNVTETLYGRIQDLRPGDKGDYTISVPASVRFELSNLRLIWTWELR